MCKRNNSALFFTCSLIEQLGRDLHMERGKIVEALGETGVGAIYEDAGILHCEPLDKISSDAAEEFSLPNGDYDNVGQRNILCRTSGRWARYTPA